MSNKNNTPAQKGNSGVTSIIVISLVLAVAMLAVGTIATLRMLNPSLFEKPVESTPAETNKAPATPAESAYRETGDVTNYVKLSVKGYGDIVMELYPDVAPITVKNFKNLVSEGFYDGLIFHRIIEGFMIQGGDPKGDGTGGSPNTIKGEFSANGVTNNLSHTRGVVSMARKSYPMDSASSQFFICNADSTHLDGQYAAFGRVVEGMDVVDAISAVSCNSSDKPLTDVVIETARFVKAK